MAGDISLADQLVGIGFHRVGHDRPVELVGGLLLVLTILWNKKFPNQTNWKKYLSYPFLLWSWNLFHFNDR